MENSPCCRQRTATARGGYDSARLLRSRSGSAAASPVHSGSERVPLRSAKKQKKQETAITTKSDGGGSFVRFLPRSRSQAEVMRTTRSINRTTSPSAWALSPGRSSPWASPATVQQSPARIEKLTKQEPKGGSGGGGGGKGVSGVLKYLRQKKVSPVLEEEYHRYRVAYNRLLQWRFANGRAEASMAAVERASQKGAWSEWVKVWMMRNAMAERRMGMEKRKRELKVYEIIKGEMGMLEEWSKMEKRNAEAVGRVVRKLKAISVCLPLLHDAQAEITGFHDAISTATQVMDSIKEMVLLDMHSQVEKTGFLVTELSVILTHQKLLFQELETSVTLAASLTVQEKFGRAQQIQLAKEVNTMEV